MKYLIRLKPLAPFFFGGEQNFSQNGKEKASYFASSTLFPQQTHLLGMIKKAILNQNDILKLRLRGEWIGKQEPQKFQKSINYVGKDQFDIAKSSKYGIIKSLSPIILTNGLNYYTIAPKDYGIKFSKISGKSLFGSTQKEFIPSLSGYDPKNGISTQLIDNNAQTYKIKDIFQKYDQVGIEKAEDGATKDEAFFNKVSYKFIDNKMEFCFVLELDDKWSQGFKLDSSMVYLGGETSPFMMSVDKDISLDTEALFVPMQISSQVSNKITLLSDAKIDKEIFEYCDYAITGKKSFRTLKGNTGEKKAYQAKTDRYFLLERGSVLFVDDTNMQKIEQILNYEPMTTIGYNKYIKTQKGN